MLSSSRMQFFTQQYIIEKYLLRKFFNLYEQYLQKEQYRSLIVFFPFHEEFHRRGFFAQLYTYKSMVQKT